MNTAVSRRDPFASLIDRENEEALCGAVLLSGGRVIGEIGPLQASDFGVGTLGRFWAACQDLASEGVPIDVLTVASTLKDLDRPAKVTADLTRLLNRCESALHAPAYAARIRDLASRRRTYLEGKALVKAALNGKTAARVTKQGGPMAADSILHSEFPEPAWAIPRLLPIGLTLFAGRPKVGKSWMALQIAQAVASGGVVLGERVQRRPVLYLALEDFPRRLQQRMRMQGWPDGLAAGFVVRSQFREWIGDLAQGGSERLATIVRQGGYGLLVIDTVSMAITGDQNDVEEMTQALAPLRDLAHQQSLALLAIDHHRKLRLDDPVADLLGSTAKGAMCDTAWGLYREQRGQARLRITGRDVEEADLALVFDMQTHCWQSEGDAVTLALTVKRQAILDALEDLGPATLKEVAEAVKEDRGSTRKRLLDLMQAGMVRRDEEGRGAHFQRVEGLR